MKIASNVASFLLCLILASSKKITDPTANYVLSELQKVKGTVEMLQTENNVLGERILALETQNKELTEQIVSIRNPCFDKFWLLLVSVDSKCVYITKTENVYVVSQRCLRQYQGEQTTRRKLLICVCRLYIHQLTHFLEEEKIIIAYFSL